MKNRNDVTLPSAVLNRGRGNPANIRADQHQADEQLKVEHLWSDDAPAGKVPVSDGAGGVSWGDALGANYVTVGPGQTYTNMEAAMNGEASGSRFLLLGAVNDDASVFDVVNYDALIIMDDESSWSLEGAVFSDVGVWIIKNVTPNLSSLNTQFKPIVDMGKTGIAATTSNLNFINLEVILSASFTSGTTVFRNCYVHIDTGMSLTASGSSIRIERCDQFNFVNGVISIDASLYVYWSNLRGNGISLTDASNDLVITHSSLNLTAQGINLVSSSDITIYDSTIITTSSNPALSVGALPTLTDFEGIWNSSFHTAHATNPAIACPVTWANARIYGCTSRNGYDANITFEAGNTSNQTS